MLEEYIFKTVISFISLNAVVFITKDNWLKLNPKRNGFIKRNINKLMWCLIPVLRWFFVISFLVIGIALGNDEFAERIKKEIKEDK